MPELWPTARIGEVADILLGFAFKSAEFSNDTCGVRLVRGDNVTEGSLRWGEKERFWPTKEPALDRYLLRDGDVVIGMDGSKVGKNWARIRQEDLPLYLVQRVACLRARGTLEQDLIPYLIGAPRFREYVESIKTGSAIPHISGKQISDFEFPIPPLPEQRAIAEVLGALDDKIESNRRVVGLFDELLMTEALRVFASCDKSAPLGSFVELAVGGVWGDDESSEKSNTQVHCLRGIDLVAIASGKVPDAPLRWVSEAQVQKRPIGPAEIWVEGSGSFCGRSLMVGSGMTELFDGPVQYSNFVKRLVPTTDVQMVAPSWLALRLAYESGEVAQARTGSAFPNLDVASLLSSVHVGIPVAEELDVLNRLASIRLSSEYVKQIVPLAQLRDTLLPALLSGRIRVPVAAELVEAS